MDNVERDDLAGHRQLGARRWIASPALRRRKVYFFASSPFSRATPPRNGQVQGQREAPRAVRTDVVVAKYFHVTS
jgi:hypothetical protein